jgi:DNA-binding MarR family transcriptional regulator
MARFDQTRGDGSLDPDREDPPFRMADWPFYWITRVTGRYFQNIELALKPIGLDVPRWRVLMALYERRTASVSEIADHAIVKLSTMTKIIQRMQADGLVTCRPSETDARVTEVTLTEIGHEARRQAWREVEVIYGRAFTGMARGDIATINGLLETVFHNLHPSGHWDAAAVRTPKGARRRRPGDENPG